MKSQKQQLTLLLYNMHKSLCNACWRKLGADANEATEKLNSFTALKDMDLVIDLANPFFFEIANLQCCTILSENKLGEFFMQPPAVAAACD
jgi:hypothetical protein